MIITQPYNTTNQKATVTILAKQKSLFCYTYSTGSSASKTVVLQAVFRLLQYCH